MAKTNLVPSPVLLPEHHNPGGVFDLFGRELSHAAHIMLLHSLFAKHPALHFLAKRAEKHIDDPTHEAHGELADAFSAHIKGVWRIERWDKPIEFYALRLLKGAGVHISDTEINARVFHDFDRATQEAARRAMQLDARRPYDVSEFEEEFTNLFTTQGVSALWNQAANGGTTNSGAAVPGVKAWFNNAQAVMGVGDSSTAAANTQFDLQAASNRLWLAMDATFPTLPGTGSNAIVFRSTFGSAQANYAWNEFAIANDGGSNVTIPGSTARSAANGSMLDRVVSAQGTKASGQTWVPSMTETIS